MQSFCQESSHLDSEAAGELPVGFMLRALTLEERV